MAGGAGDRERAPPAEAGFWLAPSSGCWALPGHRPSFQGFLQALVLSGETQERERILYQFLQALPSLQPRAFSSVGRRGPAHWVVTGGEVLGPWGPRSIGEVPPPRVDRGNAGVPAPTAFSLRGADWRSSTLTCAIMLLNTDLHGQGESLWGSWGEGTMTKAWDGVTEGPGGGEVQGGQPGVLLLEWGHVPAAPSTFLTTEHWKEHELPGIHNQPERPAGWRKLPQRTAWLYARVHVA